MKLAVSYPEPVEKFIEEGGTITKCPPAYLLGAYDFNITRRQPTVRVRTGAIPFSKGGCYHVGLGHNMVQIDD